MNKMSQPKAKGLCAVWSRSTGYIRLLKKPLVLLWSSLFPTKYLHQYMKIKKECSLVGWKK